MGTIKHSGTREERCKVLLQNSHVAGSSGRGSLRTKVLQGNAPDMVLGLMRESPTVHPHCTPIDLSGEEMF